MSVVKTKKQHQLVVVPYRPFLKAMWACGIVFASIGLTWLFYDLGMSRGADLKEKVLSENISVKQELTRRDVEINQLKRQLADIELGGEIDAQANVQVMNEIEALKTEIAELNEEISFYKGIMLPRVGEKGLRIERLDIKETLEIDKVKYTLMLTQVVDKHNYIRGEVEIKVIGNLGEEIKEMMLADISSSDKNTIGFRFRYFQTLTGEFELPEGFLPQQVLVTAKSVGRSSQTLERRFDWQVES